VSSCKSSPMEAKAGSRVIRGIVPNYLIRFYKLSGETTCCATELKLQQRLRSCSPKKAYRKSTRALYEQTHIRFGLLFGWLKHSLKALTQLDRWYAFGILYHRSSSYIRRTLYDIHFLSFYEIRSVFL